LEFRPSDGRPLLLLMHGIGTTHDDFATLSLGLAPEFLVLAHNLPGQRRPVSHKMLQSK
jgi:predicted esterase